MSRHLYAPVKAAFYVAVVAGASPRPSGVVASKAKFVLLELAAATLTAAAPRLERPVLELGPPALLQLLLRLPLLQRFPRLASAAPAV